MTYDDLVGLYGNGAKAAKELGLNRQTVHRWKDAGIPFEQQFRIQMKTKGKLKAVMPSDRCAA
jgi:hypothetical protein